MSLSIWIWVSLALAIASAFMSKPRTTIGLLAISLVVALLDERLSIVALAYLVTGFSLAYITPRLSKFPRYFGYTLLILWCLVLFLHRVPGFGNLQLLSDVIAKPQSIPFNMYLNLDKPMVFFGLLLAKPSLLGNPRSPNVRAIVITVILLLSLLPIATLMGALKLEISLPHWWWLFMFNNLIFTCVAEEAFFRGFIQQGLSERFGYVFGLIGAGILFGIAHFSGGLLFVCFATLAGIGYGLIFYLTGRLLAAVVVHFLFNLSHLIFFTYPVLAH